MPSLDLHRVEDLLHYYFQVFDYRLLLPGIARLPPRVGLRLADARGLLNAAFDLDWRSLFLRRNFVRRATYYAMQDLRPRAGRVTWSLKTLLRYIHMSREEWVAAVCYVRSMQFLLERSEVQGIEPLLAAQRAGRGIVLLSAHFGSLPAGIILLGLHGLKVNFLASDVVEDIRVHPDVSEFYRRKYRGMERSMNGGRTVYFERSPRFFHRALERGEAVIILGDLRSRGKKSFDVPFLGDVHRMARGPVHLARKTGSSIAAYLCLHERGGRYRLDCSPLQDPRGEGFRPESLYAFLDAHIRRRPEQWWAADLLETYDRVEGASSVSVRPRRRVTGPRL